MIDHVAHGSPWVFRNFQWPQRINGTLLSNPRIRTAVRTAVAIMNKEAVRIVDFYVNYARLMSVTMLCMFNSASCRFGVSKARTRGNIYAEYKYTIIEKLI